MLHQRPELDKIFGGFCDPDLQIQGEDYTNEQRVADIVEVFGPEQIPPIYTPYEKFIPPEIAKPVNERFEAVWNLVRLRKQFFYHLYHNCIGLAHVNNYEMCLSEYWEMRMSEKYFLTHEPEVLLPNGWWIQ